PQEPARILNDAFHAIVREAVFDGVRLDRQLLRRRAAGRRAERRACEHCGTRCTEACGSGAAHANGQATGRASRSQATTPTPATISAAAVGPPTEVSGEATA